VIAGTATTVSNRVSRRQANKWAQQDAQYQPQTAPYQYEQQAPPPPPPAPVAAAPAGDDRLDQLKELGRLKESGVLTDEEFAAEKARILNS